MKLYYVGLTTPCYICHSEKKYQKEGALIPDIGIIMWETPCGLSFHMSCFYGSYMNQWFTTNGQNTG